MNSLSITILLAFVASTNALLGVGRTQSVAVSGRLICNGQPASGVKLKLYEKETISTEALLGVGSVQSVAVSGRLICNGTAASGVKLKLYEKESTFDVLMDSGSSSNDGTFRLAGSKTEISTIDPKLNIYHKCNYNGLCYKKIGITIPDNYVSSGKTPQKTYDIGTLNLANQYTGETTDCIN